MNHKPFTMVEGCARFVGIIKLNNNKIYHYE